MDDIIVGELLFSSHLPVSPSPLSPSVYHSRGMYYEKLHQLPMQADVIYSDVDFLTVRPYPVILTSTPSLPKEHKNS